MSWLVASVLVWACAFQLVSGQDTPIDGLPRPEGFKDAPTKAYGKVALTYHSPNVAADCDWYGFAHVNYTVELTEKCLVYAMHKRVLANVNTQELRPYYSYYCPMGWENPLDYDVRELCYDDNWGQYYCMVGCFDLSKTTLTIPPITAVPSLSSLSPTGAPGTTAPPGITRSQGHVFLPTPSVVMVATLCAGAVAAVHLRNLW